MIFVFSIKYFVYHLLGWPVLKWGGRWGRSRQVGVVAAGEDGRGRWSGRGRLGGARQVARSELGGGLLKRLPLLLLCFLTLLVRMLGLPLVLVSRILAGLIELAAWVLGIVWVLLYGVIRLLGWGVCHPEAVLILPVVGMFLFKVRLEFIYVYIWVFCVLLMLVGYLGLIGWLLFEIARRVSLFVGWLYRQVGAVYGR